MKNIPIVIRHKLNHVPTWPIGATNGMRYSVESGARMVRAEGALVVQELKHAKNTAQDTAAIP